MFAIYLLNDLEICCDKCNNVINVSKDDIYLECVGNYERNMGNESQYEVNEELMCPCCGNEIKYYISCWEYPVGALNYDTYNIFGGKFISSLEFEVFFDDIYELYYCQEFCQEIDRINEIIIRIQQNNDYIYQITPREFEEVIAEIFEKLGYEVILTVATRDGGKDLVMKRTLEGGIKLLIYVECKQYSLDRKVGVDIVRAVRGVHSMDNVNKSIIITTSKFTRDAQNLASKNELITLIDNNQLLNLINSITAN